MDGSDSLEEDFNLNAWDYPNSFETQKKHYETPRELETSDFSTVFPSVQSPNYVITSFPLDNYSTPSNRNPRPNCPTDDSGYFTSPRSFCYSAESQSSPMNVQRVNSPEKPKSRLFAEMSTTEIDFTPKRPAIDLTAIETIPPKKSILERLLTDDPSEDRAKIPEREYTSPPRKIRRASGRQRNFKSVNQYQRVPGPYQNSWLNEVYWFHFNDYMKTNYYDVMAASDLKQMQKNVLNSCHDLSDQPANGLALQDQEEQASEDGSTEGESLKDNDVEIIEEIILA